VKSAVCVPYEAEQTPHDQAAGLVAQHRQLLDDFSDRLGVALLRSQDEVRSNLFRAFVAQTASWSDEARRAVLARYLGFPYWDRLAYPYTAFTGVGELRHIQVIRFSPNDARSLSDKGAKKLAGSELGHFGAFFSRPGREKDYVWGRLDGAERVMRLLEAEPGEARPVQEAIVAEEARDAEVSARVLDEIRPCLEPGGC
jgi:hypothetical protein